MALYAIGDLHLSLGTDKPMDVFGGAWAGYLEKLRAGYRISRDQVRDELLHTVACKAAIKAGRRSEPRELLELARRVMAGEVKYCPHGRPVSITIEKKELDKRFDRIV